MNEFRKSALAAKDRGEMRLAARITTEGRIAGKLVTAALTLGHTVSVYDSGEWTVKRSAKRSEIVNALFTSDDDQLVIRNKAGEKLAWFHLVYGNDGYDVISDHSDNDLGNALFNLATRGEG